jgi:glycosyltransferase involved in cell wall biosynthesis
MTHATLSVLMTNYNHAHYLPVSVGAILAQERSPTELLIVDDRSTDDSLSVLERFERERPIVRVLRNEKNVGVVANINRLVSLSSGDYIYGAAADDWVLPGFFAEAMELLERYPQAALCLSPCWLMSETGERLGMSPAEPIVDQPRYLPPDECAQLVRRHVPWISGPSCILRRDAVVAEGLYDPTLHSFCDEFLNTVLALKHGVCYIPTPRACIRMSHSGYAASSIGNTEIARRIRTRAVELMLTRYADLFPESYAREWEARFRFNIQRRALRRLYPDHEARLAQILEGDRVGYVLGNTLLSAAHRVVTLVLALYLVLRSPHLIPLLTRRRLMRALHTLARGHAASLWAKWRRLLAMTAQPTQRSSPISPCSAQRRRT